MDNSTEVSNTFSNEPTDSCIDRNGRDIPHGYYYTPGYKLFSNSFYVSLLKYASRIFSNGGPL